MESLGRGLFAGAPVSLPAAGRMPFDNLQVNSGDLVMEVIRWGDGSVYGLLALCLGVSATYA